MLGPISRAEAVQQLASKMALAGTGQPLRSRVSFRTLVTQWEATVLPVYKHSTQKHRRVHAQEAPRCRGSATRPCRDITRQEIQAYVADLTQHGYAPKSIDHIHDVLSAILRTAVKWGHLQDNPARGVDLPHTQDGSTEVGAHTRSRRRALLEALPPLGRAMAGLGHALRACGAASCSRCGGGTSTRRHDCSRCARRSTTASFSTPKTEAGRRQIPLSDHGVEVARSSGSGTRIGSNRTRSCSPRAKGNPLSPNNVLRRMIFPACDALALPRATWLTFRRTYSSWSHDKGVPGKVVAQLMGHANVDTTLNVYTQVLDGSVRAAVEKVGDELFTIVHKPEGTGSDRQR